MDWVRWVRETVKVVTYSLLNGAELLELLTKSILIGVPGKASVTSISM